MPTISTSGAGFMPQASDAYGALLSRMPQWAEEAMARKQRMGDQAEKDAGQAHYAREQEMARQAEMDKERKDAIARAEREKVQARKDAESAQFQASQRERADQQALSKVAQNRVRTSWIGNRASDAADTASANFVKMRLGVPGAY